MDGRNKNTTLLISIHAPHEGERPVMRSKAFLPDRFQSTLPTRGSDHVSPMRSPKTGDFNPRSPRGGATEDNSLLRIMSDISIHAPHEGERPTPRRSVPRAPQRFQSTLPTRGSDPIAVVYPVFRGGISIHAPHEGERHYTPVLPRWGLHISIHAPHEGERLARLARRLLLYVFQSTLPTRGSDHP